MSETLRLLLVMCAVVIRAQAAVAYEPTRSHSGDPAHVDYANTPGRDMYVDMPHRVEPGVTNLPVMFLIHGATASVGDYDFEGIHVFYGERELYSQIVNRRIADDVYNLYESGDYYLIAWVPIGDLPRSNTPIPIRVHIDENGDFFDPDGDFETTMLVRFSPDPLPNLPGYLPVDLHWHSTYTDNVY